MPAAAELADKPQLALREAVRESDLLMHCKGAFIVGSTGNDGQDALRRLVVELFQASAACKLLDFLTHQGNICRDLLQHAARAHGIHRKGGSIGCSPGVIIMEQESTSDNPFR